MGISSIPVWGVVLGALGAVAAKKVERDQRVVINNLQDNARSKANQRAEFIEVQNARKNRGDRAIDARRSPERRNRFQQRSEVFDRDFGFSTPNPSAFADFTAAALQGAAGGGKVGQDVLKGISAVKKLEALDGITKKEGEKARGDIIKKSINDGTLGSGENASQQQLSEPIQVRNRQFEQGQLDDATILNQSADRVRSQLTNPIPGQPIPQGSPVGLPVEKSIFGTQNNQNILTPGVNPFSKFG